MQKEKKKVIPVISTKKKSAVVDDTKPSVNEQQLEKDFSLLGNNNLVISRMLSHKFDIPFLYKW